MEQETNASLYRSVLLDSEYTIAPAGLNTEYATAQCFLSISESIDLNRDLVFSHSKV